MDALLSSPTHDEETGSEEERTDHHRHQAGFGNCLVVVSDRALAVVGLAPEVDGRSESNSYNNGEKRDRSHYFVPAAYFLKLDGERCDRPKVLISQVQRLGMSQKMQRRTGK